MDKFEKLVKRYGDCRSEQSRVRQVNRILGNSGDMHPCDDDDFSFVRLIDSLAAYGRAVETELEKARKAFDDYNLD